MARSDKVPFRREFTMTSAGYAGTAEGFFVGDILSLHIDFSTNSTSCLIEGKVGRQGIWETLAKNSGTGHFTNLDIRAYEYVRIQIFNIVSSTNIVMFGYETNIDTEEVTIKYNDRDFLQLCRLTDSNKNIEELLTKLNEYMEILTGEKL
jgi:hypothetical protein